MKLVFEDSESEEEEVVSDDSEEELEGESSEVLE